MRNPSGEEQVGWHDFELEGKLLFQNHNFLISCFLFLNGSLGDRRVIYPVGGLFVLEGF